MRRLALLALIVGCTGDAPAASDPVDEEPTDEDDPNGLPVGGIRPPREATIEGVVAWLDQQRTTRSPGTELSITVEDLQTHERVSLRGATQTIGADAAGPADADLLKIQAGSPVLRCERVTTDTSGRPVLMSEHVFPAHRTEFVVDLPQAEPSITPSGLRLVE